MSPSNIVKKEENIAPSTNNNNNNSTAAIGTKETILNICKEKEVTLDEKIIEKLVIYSDKKEKRDELKAAKQVVRDARHQQRVLRKVEKQVNKAERKQIRIEKKAERAAKKDNKETEDVEMKVIITIPKLNWKQEINQVLKEYPEGTVTVDEVKAKVMAIQMAKVQEMMNEKFNRVIKKGGENYLYTDSGIKVIKTTTTTTNIPKVDTEASKSQQVKYPTLDEVDN